MGRTMIRDAVQRNRHSISVIIVSYRRRDYLTKALQCLRRQTHAPDQVIVVDASPVEEQLKESQGEQLFNWFEYIRHEESGNVSRQRNVGIARATGDIVPYLDDDVEFAETLIEDYFAAFAETRADGISGFVLVPGQLPSNEPWWPDTALLNPGGPNYQPFEGVIETHVICTANFGIYRQVLLDVGGFDETIFGTFDDVELGLRLAQAGFLILHHNRPRVLHFRAAASGSRSTDFRSAWHYSNLFYFQLRHFWGTRRRRLFFLSLWQHCRPSRHWFTPMVIARRASALYGGYLEASRRLNSGPKLIGQSRAVIARTGAP